MRSHIQKKSGFFVTLAVIPSNDFLADQHPRKTIMNDSENNDSCTQCGEKFAKASGTTICPACLMRLAIHPSPSEILPPAIDVTQSIVLESGESQTNEFPELQPNQMFGDYLIVGRLGRGGMGVVYEADHQPSARRVALKVMGHSLDNPEARARFLREGRLAASINHPNSVYVYGTEEIQDRPTISMELVRGETLGQRVKASGNMRPKEAVDAILQIVDGMEAAYNAGVLHRDIKPNNCFVDADGHVKVGDFGLSITATGRDLPAGAELAQTQTEITQVGTFLGTPAYASPEQLRGEPLDHRSDIYAIGVTLYYLLTGEVPFAADNMIQLLARVLDNKAPSLKEKSVDAPEDLERVIAKCLKKAPGDRFASYTDLRTALLPLSSRVPTPATLGTRFLAGALDTLLISIAVSPLSIWLMSTRMTTPASNPFPGMQSVSDGMFSIVLLVVYYAGCEWRFGKTLGKRMMGICVLRDNSRPPFFAALVRALLWVIPPVLPSIVLGWLAVDPSVRTFSSFWVALGFAVIGWAPFLIKASMFLTARARNGNAAIHDLVTQTRVVETPVVDPPVSVATTHAGFDATAGIEMIGPYHILSRLVETDEGTRTPGNETHGTWMLVYDAKLLRRVWVHVRPAGAPPLSSAWRTTNRSGRLRWLGGHSESERTWDAFEALPGWELSNEQAGALDWRQAAGVLRQLLAECQDSGDDDDLSHDFSVNHLWVMPDGGLKLLPFAIDGDSTIAGVVDLVKDPSAEGSFKRSTTSQLGVIQSVAALFSQRYRLTQPAGGGMSLADASVIDEIKTADSLGSANRSIARLTSRASVSVRYRVAGMIAASLMISCFTIFSMAMMTMMFNRQEASMPRVLELADIVIMLQQEPNVSNPDVIARVKSLRAYARANYRDVWEDPAKMHSIYGMTLLSTHRTQLNTIFNAPDPSPAEAEAAAADFEAIREHHGDLPRLKNEVINAHNGIFWAAITWVYFIWLPSLVTALLFRGGLLLRLFGLTFVNSKGQRASGLRVSIRMLATGLLPVCIAILVVIAAGWNSSEEQIEVTMRYVSASIVVIACLAVMIYRSRGRFFSDRCAGTFLVAR